MAYMTQGLVAVTAALALSVTGGAVAAPAQADPRETAKTSTATGYGGAVSTVDPEASAAAIEVLRKGGNAADAAVAAAATLGVTEPYSAGIGGGGYFVYYDAKTGKVGTIDGRETAPAGMPHNAFIDPATGKPYNFTPELVTSGVSVGVPGTPATWARALDRWGTLSLGDALKPAINVATRGFVVDETFRQQTLDNKARFEAFHLDEQPLPPRRRRPRRRQCLPEPRPRRDIPAPREEGHGRLLRRAARGGDRGHGPGSAQDFRHKAARSGRAPDDGGSRRIPRPGSGAHARGLPRPGRLRHGALQQRRHHGGRGAEHPGRPSTCPGCPRRAPCTTTSRPARLPSRTVASTWGTPRSSTFPPPRSRTRCSARNAPARSTRCTRQRSRLRRGTCPRTTARARPPPPRPPTRRTPRTSRRPT